MASRAFGSEVPSFPHRVDHEEADLRADVENGFQKLEGRVGYPHIGKVTGGTAVSLGAVPVAKAIAGTGFLQGQVAATLALGTGTSALTFTANRPGTPGNGISVEILTGGALAVAVVGQKISVTVNTGVTTANAAKAAIDADTAAHALVQVVSGGAGVLALSAEKPLAGGVGAGLEVKIFGIEQSVYGLVTDTAIPMGVIDLGTAANGDAVALQIKSNGVTSNAITLGVVV
jgi:hypothetical protein